MGSFCNSVNIGAWNGAPNKFKAVCLFREDKEHTVCMQCTAIHSTHSMHIFGLCYIFFWYLDYKRCTAGGCLWFVEIGFVYASVFFPSITVSFTYIGHKTDSRELILTEHLKLTLVLCVFPLAKTVAQQKCNPTLIQTVSTLCRNRMLQDG